MSINWKKGFNRLWLFFSITIGLLVLAAVTSIDGFSRATIWALACFVVTLVVGHIVFRAVSWIIQGFRSP